MLNNIFFSWCDPGIDVLLGLQSANVIVEDMDTGEERDTYMLSFGFLIFRIDLIF